MNPLLLVAGGIALAALTRKGRPWAAARATPMTTGTGRGCPRGMFRSGSGKCVFAEGGQSPYGMIPRLFYYRPQTDSGDTGGHIAGLALSGLAE